MKAISHGWSLWAVALLWALGCGVDAGTGSSDKPPTEPPVGPAPGVSLEVSVSVNVTGGVAPLEVSFQSTVSGGEEPLVYHWDFGDGSIDSLPSPVHTYQSVGNFMATLSVKDALENSGSATVEITVGDQNMPVVQATANPASGTVPLIVQFTGVVSGGDAPVNIEWQFGDGGTSNELAPEYTYNLPGSYVAIFTAVDADGDMSDAKIVIQVASDEQPVAAATATPTSGAAPLNVQFAANAAGGDPPLAYSWEFGDGGNATDSDPMHTYTVDGVYTATVRVTDADGDEATSSVSVIVQTSPPQADSDLQVPTFDYLLIGFADIYEPNDTAGMAYYLGPFGYSYSWSNGYIDPYDAVFRAVVANVGPSIGDAFAVDVYYDMASAPSLGAFGDDYEPILSLGENATKDVYFSWPNPGPGTYTAWCQVDSDDFIKESDENNNLGASLNVTVISDEDWFSFIQTEGYAIQIDLGSLPDDYDLYLYDQNGTYVDGSFNAGTSDESIDILAPSTGTYYVAVVGYNGASSGTLPYSMMVTIP